MHAQHIACLELRDDELFFLGTGVAAIGTSTRVEAETEYGTGPGFLLGGCRIGIGILLTLEPLAEGSALSEDKLRALPRPNSPERPFAFGFEFASSVLLASVSNGGRGTPGGSTSFSGSECS